MHPSNRLPRVAVCLAAYNGMCFLPAQLDSILSQKNISATVFVSVDKSSDGTELWFDNESLEDERIIVLPHGEHFGGAAKNFFRILRDVDFQNFDYMCFADQDDVWFEEKIDRAIQVIKKNDADAYSSNVIAFWGREKKILIKKNQPQKKWDYIFEAAGPGCTYVMTAKLVIELKNLISCRWESIQEVGLHDWFSYAFARSNGYKWIIDKRPGMFYRQHADNQVGVNEGLAAFKYRFMKVIDGWGLNQSYLIADLVGLKDDPFVVSWKNMNSLSMLRLATQASHCRRRRRDRIFFALSCVLLSVVPIKNKYIDK